MTRPKTAVRGNLYGSLGMLIAVIATLLAAEVVSYVWIIVGVLVGGGIGTYFAITIKMEKMPEMVALFNG
ncbi:NAD(P)(+) transhydrogenase (Re/Si-specific) subunit beta, partial [bacterium]|nr:NAD(P)(+) transhydrogenase (Re/Si-specific) subunit beta [bacterium]